jgi:hypothetical protein
MKKEYFQNRSWAETVRLYSGLLPEEKRNSFIRDLAEKSILLASECRSVSFNEDDEMDNYLAKIAIEVASNFKKPKSSAEALMALAELNQFDEISKIIGAVSKDRTTTIHYEIVANFVDYGSEVQIATFLTALVSSNQVLFRRAIDRVFNKSLQFSTLSIAQCRAVLEKLFQNGDTLNFAKSICTFKLISKHLPFEVLLDTLISNLEVKYAKALFSVFNRTPEPRLVFKLPLFIEAASPKPIVLQFLQLCETAKSPLDYDYIRIQISTHLNPLVKSLIFQIAPTVPMSTELLTRICRENIRIGRKSCVEFAYQLIEDYSIKDISINELVDSLLNDQKPGRLAYACKLIEQYQLYEAYPVHLLFEFLINTKNLLSFELARDLILRNPLPRYEVTEKLERLACVSIVENIHKKFGFEVLIRDLNGLETSEPAEGVEYFGVVINRYNGHVYIAVAHENKFVTVPINKYRWMRLNFVIRLRIVNRVEGTTNASIDVISSNVIRDLQTKYYRDHYFIGKVLTLTIKEVGYNEVQLVDGSNHRYRFVLPFIEIFDARRTIPDLKPQATIRVIISSFHASRPIIYVSMKRILKTSNIDSAFDEKDTMAVKLSILQNKYKKS